MPISASNASNPPEPKGITSIPKPEDGVQILMWARR